MGVGGGRVTTDQYCLQIAMMLHTKFPSETVNIL